MSKLSIISARELLKILHKIAYAVDHQTESRIILRNKHLSLQEVNYSKP